MSAIPVSFTGVMWYPDLSVGGGPMPGGPPLGFWGGVAPPLPTHPIAPGGPPPQIWPSPGVPTHPIYYPPGPVDPGYGVPWRPRPPVDPGYGYPLHPVDPGYGVPVGGPPRPTHPIYYPPGTQPHPEHPIYFPPPGSPPPLGIWGGPFDPPRPTHPIVLPPNLPPEIPPPEGGGPSTPIEWKVAWTPTTGWIVVGVPSGAHPTPSAAPN